MFIDLGPNTLRLLYSYTDPYGVVVGDLDDLTSLTDSSFHTIVKQFQYVGHWFIRVKLWDGVGEITSIDFKVRYRQQSIKIDQNE